MTRRKEFKELLKKYIYMKSNTEMNFLIVLQSEKDLEYKSINYFFRFFT